MYYFEASFYILSSAQKSIAYLSDFKRALFQLYLVPSTDNQYIGQKKKDEKTHSDLQSNKTES